KLGAAFAMLLEFEFRAEQSRVRRDECRAIILEQFGRRQLAVPFGQFRFVIEQFEMTRPARLKEVNDAFGFRFKMRLLRRERIVAEWRSPAIPGKELAKCDGAQADAALLEKPAAGDLRRIFDAI